MLHVLSVARSSQAAIPLRKKESYIRGLRVGSTLDELANPTLSESEQC